MAPRITNGYSKDKRPDLKQLDDLLFISRFPANFKEHDRVIGQAMDAC